MRFENHLNKFLEAQENIYPQVINELKSGRKTSHWMWFIFPQIKGLGHSSTAQYYSISNIAEAKEYFDHPILGKRLIECCEILLNLRNRSADEIFGYPDNMKLRSSMTLFKYAAPGEKAFEKVMEKYFNGEEDQRTVEILKGNTQ